jgi:predicted RNA binding protein YcfA (HicA-like mRNA interferase family)
MPRLRPLSGDEVIAILLPFGFLIHSQKGSHVKLKRADEGATQILTIPKHRQLDRGTLRAIFRQAARFVPEDQLRRHFYSE